MRRFNTEGPIRPEDHYHVPPLERVDLDQVLDMIQRKRYFVLHAPRQTGKTSALLALRDLLNRGEQGDFRCVYVNVEAAQAHREDLSGAMRTILGALADHALLSGDPFLDEVWLDILTSFGPGGAVATAPVPLPRVRRVVEPILSGGDEPRYHLHDLDYVRDLGLVARDSPPRIANPIYAEVVPRELGYVLQDSLDQDAAWYVDAGGLNVDRLLAAFQEFFRVHSEHWLGRFDYQEAGPQLILQAFLQRVVNGGGRIEREYGLGRGRTDLLILWPEGGRPSDLWSKFVVECKVFHEGKRQSLEGTIGKGIEQTLRYMDRCGSEAGHLIVFDRTEGKGWEEKVFRREVRRDGRTVIAWGM